MAFNTNVSGEGTREMAPNGNIIINESMTTDVAALHINHPSYNNFASYTNADPHSRLYIHITDPAKECVYLGFSFGHMNVTSPTPTRLNYEYRVKDPAGNVVFGPVTIPSTGGNIQNWSQGFTGPMQIHGAAGFNAHHITSADLASQGWTGKGDYYVEFLSAGDADVLIDFWDITVADCAPPTPVEKKGRIWSYNWSIFSINDFGFPTRPFNGAFYVCAPDPDDVDKAFITKIDFNGSGFRPAAFNIAFNRFGSQNTGDIETDRKSIELFNATQSEYAIFLNDPVELCETAVVGQITLNGISRCDAGDYCIKFTTSKEGQVDLLLDFDGQDDVFTPGTRDVLITHIVTPGEVGIPSCIAWNGLDGLGNLLPEVAGTQIPITISYAQGIYHFPIYDAEFMTDGFRLEAVRPAASIPLLYYDDSNITTLSGSGEPPVQLSGCSVPCHRWSTFVNNTVSGFGNLNTINSWWFSQRIVRQDVLVLPGYYTCEIEGPLHICQGSTTQVVLNPLIHPSAIEGPQIISTIWTGPGIIGSPNGNTVTVGSAGMYHVEVVWLTGLGDTCSTSCDYQLAIDPPLTQTIDTLIVQGDILNVNGELYTEAGQYIQELTTASGCDSILTINVKVIQTVIYYDLNACESFMSNGSHMDYSEFTVDQPEPLSCADITASILFREPASMQKHSCTPGVNNSMAMCISSLDTCDYDAGSNASLVFEVSITPDPDTAVHVTGFSFFQKAPLTYDWVSGGTGPNNYPTMYGLRILKNGIEIYRRENISTSLVWTEQDYSFLDENEFIIEDPATFRFELLPYCLIGNGATVAAWDLDEIRISASCAPFEGLSQIISGIVKTPEGEVISNVSIKLNEHLSTLITRSTHTNENGKYLFENVQEGSACNISAHHNTDFTNGVSTLDLVHIQKHLLGIKSFDSPYKYIAADANKSNHVSAKDLLELRKLILGITTELPQNTSWRFGTADDALNGAYPWGFKETIDIERLQNDFLNADFTAVKIGDVNGDADVNMGSPDISSRSSEVFYLSIKEQMLSTGIPVTVDFYASDFIDLAGMQFCLQLNDLKILEITGGSLSVADENILVSENEVRFSWSNHVTQRITSDSKVFSIRFLPVQSGPLSSMLSLKNEILNAEVYRDEELITQNIKILISDNILNEKRNQLFQNEPNPFSENTIVRFTLETSGIATIRTTDLSGRILKEHTQYYEKGFHHLEFTNQDFSIENGMMICQLYFNGYMETIKMSRIK